MHIFFIELCNCTSLQDFMQERMKAISGLIFNVESELFSYRIYKYTYIRANEL